MVNWIKRYQRLETTSSKILLSSFARSSTYDFWDFNIIYFEANLNSLSSSSSSSFELSAFRANSWSSVGSLLAWTKPEVSLGFSVPRSSQKKHSLAIRSKLGQLVESQSASFGLMNSVCCCLGEFQSADSETLRKVEESCIIGDWAYDCDNSGVEFGFSLRDSSSVVGEMLDNSGDWNRIAIEARLVESFVNDLIELSISPAAEERVKLYWDMSYFDESL